MLRLSRPHMGATVMTTAVPAGRAPDEAHSGQQDGSAFSGAVIGDSLPAMSEIVQLYDTYYGQLADDPQAAVRRETYGEDLGQSSWITLDEAMEWYSLMALTPQRKALEVACGSGGITLRMARETGARCVGVDINPNAISAAGALREKSGLADRVDFQIVDAGKRLPFDDASFDAIFCNDAILHLPDRATFLADWFRVLRPGGRVLYTDPIVVTGQLTSEEIRIRSSIGFFVFTPSQANERMLESAGFRMLEVRNVTGAVASVSRKWREARARREEALVPLEGAETFEGIQRFLEMVHRLSSEERMSRYMYLAEKPAG